MGRWNSMRGRADHCRGLEAADVTTWQGVRPRLRVLSRRPPFCRSRYSVLAADAGVPGTPTREPGWGLTGRKHTLRFLDQRLGTSSPLFMVARSRTGVAGYCLYVLGLIWPSTRAASPGVRRSLSTVRTGPERIYSASFENAWSIRITIT